ncbi:MAG: glutaredoxin 3 [Gammaproteobacteria bacterium]|nr:glutaredoxin 3 [Gammaproteobacteria bacterium]
MTHVILYSTALCPFCARAKRLLKKKGVAWEELQVDRDQHLRQEMEQKTNSHEVPQIFIDGVHIGGYDALVELDFEDALDPLLGIDGSTAAR